MTYVRKRHYVKPAAASVAICIGLSAASAIAQAPRLNSWKIIGPGGGGTMISPTISPHDSSLVVEYCDMTGGYITGDSGESWRMFNLRGGIEAYAFDPKNDNTIYAGNAAVWRTIDRGKTWKMLFPNPASKTVEHQVGDHAEYLLTSDDAVYPGGGVSAIAVDPGHTDHIFVAMENRGGPTVKPGTTTIVATLDNGLTWKKFATLPTHASLLTTSGDSLIAMAGTVAYRISSTGEASKSGEVPGKIKSVAAGHSGGAVWLYATNYHGQLFSSQDSGQSWREVTPAFGQSAGRFEAVGVSDRHPEIAYAGFRGLQLETGLEHLYNGIAKTADGGRTWKIVFKESTRPAENLKATWIEERASQKGEDVWFDSAWSLGVAPTDPEVVYATDLFRTYRSLDGGAKWQEMNSAKAQDDAWVSRGLDVTTDYGVQFDPFDQKHVFIDYTDMGLFQSKDGGTSWRSSTEGVPESWRNTTYWVAFDPQVKGHMWGAFSGVHDLPRPKMFRSRSPSKYAGGIGVSIDGGLHWKPSGAGMPPTSVTHVLLDPESAVGRHTLYATAFGRGVYKSIDDGATWALKNEGLRSTEPFAWRLTRTDDGVLYLVVARRDEGKTATDMGSGALYRSTDKAEHWEPIKLPEGVTGPTALELDPRNQQRMYLTAWGHEGESADSGGGVYVSENGGKSWKTLFTASQHVYDLTIDPKNSDTLYICGFDAAAYRSTDRGVTWTKLGGYNFKWGHRVVIDPVDATQIYITTYGGGVWHGPAVGDGSHDDVATPVPVAE